MESAIIRRVVNSITVTSQNALNYGAVLQAHALHQQLLMLNVNDELVDLKCLSPKYFSPWKINRYFISTIYINFIKLIYIIPFAKKVLKFRKFIKKNIKTTKKYNSMDEIRQTPPIADIYITGSDQMFNANSEVNNFNFLKFGAENTPRISFATSMGRKQVSEELQNDFIAAIQRYSYLSVREETLAEYIAALCGKDCSVNLDPTFLLDKEEWFQFTGDNPIKEKYILCYALLYNPLVNPAIAKLKRETGLKVVVISAEARNRVSGDKVIRSAGIEEFLTLFRHAEQVLTTSFHGTCFSIIFEKPFYSFIREDAETRITHIAKKLGLEDRIVTDLSQMTFHEVDYAPVREIIMGEKQKSIAYLKTALGIHGE